MHWEPREGSVEMISSGKLSFGVFFYPLLSSVGSYTTLTSVASSGALRNVTNICQTCGVCLCECLLGVFPRLGSWLSFVIWKSIKGDCCQIKDFSTILTNRSRHSLAEVKTSKLWDWQTKVPKDMHCPGRLGKVSLLGTGEEQHPMLPHEVKWNLSFSFNWPCCEGLGMFYPETGEDCPKSFIPEVIQNWQPCQCMVWVKALLWCSSCWVRQID